MPRDRAPKRYSHFHNEISTSSTTSDQPDTNNHHHTFKLMDRPQHNAIFRNSIVDFHQKPSTTTESRWQRCMVAMRRTIFCLSEEKPARNCQPITPPPRNAFWCWCGSWCGRSTHQAPTSPSRYNQNPSLAEIAALRSVGYSPAEGSIAFHGHRRMMTSGGKPWKVDDSFRSNSDRFLETLEQDMEAERILQCNRGKRPIKASQLFRGILVRQTGI